MVQILSIIICRITPKYFLNCVIIILPPIEKKKKGGEDRNHLRQWSIPIRSLHRSKILLNKTRVYDKEFRDIIILLYYYTPHLKKNQPFNMVLHNEKVILLISRQSSMSCIQGYDSFFRRIYCWLLCKRKGLDFLFAFSLLVIT